MAVTDLFSNCKDQEELCACTCVPVHIEYQVQPATESQWSDWFEAAVLMYVSWDSGLPRPSLLKSGGDIDRVNAK